MCNYYLFSKDKHNLFWDGFHVIQTSNSQRLIGGKPQKLINQSKEINCIISVNHFNPGWWKHERKSFKYQKKKKKKSQRENLNTQDKIPISKKVKLASARWDLNERAAHKGGHISTSMVLIDLWQRGSVWIHFMCTLTHKCIHTHSDTMNIHQREQVAIRRSFRRLACYCTAALFKSTTVGNRQMDIKRDLLWLTPSQWGSRVAKIPATLLRGVLSATPIWLVYTSIFSVLPYIC